MKIVWTKLALHDLLHIRKYISADNPKAADDLLETIGKAIENLTGYPNMGRSGRVKGTRELAVIGTPYLVPYRVKKDRVEIVAVLHGSRKWPDEI